MNDQITAEFTDRLITLPDGRPGLRGMLQIETRAPSREESIRENSSNSCLDFISSDETLDRYGEIIVASGWRLDNYRRNPVFQNAHQYGDVIFTLGRALITEVRGRTSSESPHLFQRIEFATEVNPMARIAYGLYKGKFLNAVSVGFVPLRWKDASEKSSTASQGPDEIRNAQHAIRSDLDALSRSQTPTLPRRIYLEQELLEVSAVGIPANPNALALGLKSGAVEKSDLRELNELIRQTLGDKKEKEDKQWQPVPIKVKRPTRKQQEYAELLRLAKEIREILRA